MAAGGLSCCVLRVGPALASGQRWSQARACSSTRSWGSISCTNPPKSPFPRPCFSLGAHFEARKMDLFRITEMGDGSGSIPNTIRHHPAWSRASPKQTSGLCPAGCRVLSQDLHSAAQPLLGDTATALRDSSRRARGCVTACTENSNILTELFNKMLSNNSKKL